MFWVVGFIACFAFGAMMTLKEDARAREKARIQKPTETREDN